MMSSLTETETKLFDLLRTARQPMVDLRADRALLASVSKKPSNLLYRLHKKGLAHPIQRGRFFVQLDGQPTPRPRFATLDPLADALLRRFESPYLVSWHSALWRHGITDQQSLRLHVAVPMRKRPAQVGRVMVDFITVPPEKLVGVDQTILRRTGVRVATVEKALVDSLSRPELAGGMSTVISAFQQACTEERLSSRRLVECAIAMDSPMLNRRLGYLMDEIGIPDSDSLLPFLGRKHGVALVPGMTPEGKANSKWRIYEDEVTVGAGLHQR
jgi:predicted transcriptional regulator of viral defense system